MPREYGPTRYGPLDGSPRRRPAKKEAGASVRHDGLGGSLAERPRAVSGVYAGPRTMVWPWIDPLIGKATATCTIDLGWLLAKNNTLYYLSLIHI